MQLHAPVSEPLGEHESRPQASPTSDFGTRDVPVQLEATFNYLRDAVALGSKW